MLSADFHKYGGIRPAMHPASRRCSSVKYTRYSPSSRLATRAGPPTRQPRWGPRAPRRPRCVTVFMKGSTKWRGRGFSMIRQRAGIGALLIGLAGPISAWAQAATGQPPESPAFTLDRAMQYALDHYPTVRAALERVNASTAGVSVARAAYLPRL